MLLKNHIELIDHHKTQKTYLDWHAHLLRKSFAFFLSEKSTEQLIVNIFIPSSLAASQIFIKESIK